MYVNRRMKRLARLTFSYFLEPQHRYRLLQRNSYIVWDPSLLDERHVASMSHGTWEIYRSKHGADC